MTSIGVGLIGTGYMGKCHALAWNAVGPVFGGELRPRLVHLADVPAAQAEARAQDFGFVRATADWRDVVADPEVGVISITTPNALHAEMAVAALEAGKHVWCEKPMAVTLADAERMAAAARAAGRVAILGYNYIQNPVIREIGRLLAAGEIGAVTHVRCEMDEDFMAAAPFNLKSEAASGHGALDDFGVHPLSLFQQLVGPLRRVLAQQSRPQPERLTAAGESRAVETWDIAAALLEFASGATGVLALNRAAWGRKGRIALQLFGTTGSIAYDQERMNEFQFFKADDPPAGHGFRTVLCGPQHPPYDRFVAAPGHGLGFNDLKTIECHELLQAIAGRPARVVDFAGGLEIERAVHAMARSHETGRWVEMVPT